MGQKDYQQCLVINKLIQLVEMPVNIVIAPTSREEDGLAISSRNTRLNEDDRKKASAIFNALTYIKQNIAKKNLAKVKQDAVEQILHAGFDKVEYVEIADAKNLQAISSWNENKNTIAVAAAFLNGVRLIDNMPL